MPTVPTPAQIRAQVASVWSKMPDARVIGIRAPLTVETGEWMRIGEAELPVARCDSVLEIRDRLEGHAEGGAPMVLLTPLDEAELGADVVARLAKRQLFPIEPWQILKDRFRARFVDPRLVQNFPWVAQALLEAEPEGGYPPAPSGFIQADLVWDVLFGALLGLDGGERDAEGLVEWSLNSAKRQRAQRLDPRIRKGLGEAVALGSGPAAARVFDCATGPHGERTLAVGLVIRVIYGEAADGDSAAAKATGKLEAWLGGGELSADTALTWAEAAERVAQGRLAQRPSKEVAPVLKQADGLLAELGVADRAYRSRFLTSGFEQRLGQFADALQAVVKGKAKPKTSLPGLGEASAAVLDHVLSAHERARVDGVVMAGRLARWLVLQREQKDSPAGSLAEAARLYRNSSGYVDWARAQVWEGDPLAPLGKAYTALWEVVGKVREAENRRFGQVLANWSKTGSHDDSVIQVEEVIRRVVAPLARSQPVLLVVIDGMGMAVYRELLNDLGRGGWIEIDASTESCRLPVIAALPTVTEVSRASLLSGKLLTGVAANEKDGFSKHPALLAAGTRAKPPVLYHKSDLTGPDSVGVAPMVLTTIADVQRRVVGVVINAVDDHLAKGDQLRVDWTLHRIKPLEELLGAARDAGRALILVSDHGHIAEHNTTGRGEEGAERWREATGKLRDDEVLLVGPRVLLGNGRKVVAPWSERVRFSAKKNGYHGGASPQEVIIPLGMFVPAGISIDGWTEAAPEVPAWWEPGAEEVVGVPTQVEAPKLEPSMAPGEQGSLFPSEPERAAASAGPDWVDRLMASAMFSAQQKMASRVALPDERIRAMLAALDERGGKLTRPALAKRLGVPPMRLGGMISALRRLLNVEGYAVLSVDEQSDTVVLNRQQLFAQFGL